MQQIVLLSSASDSFALMRVVRIFSLEGNRGAHISDIGRINSGLILRFGVECDKGGTEPGSIKLSSFKVDSLDVRLTWCRGSL